MFGQINCTIHMIVMAAARRRGNKSPLSARLSLEMMRFASGFHGSWLRAVRLRRARQARRVGNSPTQGRPAGPARKSPPPRPVPPSNSSMRGRPALGRHRTRDGALPARRFADSLRDRCAGQAVPGRVGSAQVIGFRPGHHTPSRMAPAVHAAGATEETDSGASHRSFHTT